MSCLSQETPKEIGRRAAHLSGLADAVLLILDAGGDLNEALGPLHALAGEVSNQASELNEAVNFKISDGRWS